MKAKCYKSGIKFEVSHFPYTLGERDYLAHPCFNLPTNKLVGLIPKYIARQLSEEDIKLLFLSLLDSTGLIRWDATATISLATCEKYLLPLADICLGIYNTKHPEKHFASLAITYENCKLTAIGEIIKGWQESKEALAIGYRHQDKMQISQQKEAALARIIRSSSKDLESYAARLAEWAANAAKFPERELTLEDGTKTTIAAYWKQIIRQCGAKNLNPWSIDKGDLLDIQEWLGEHLELGTIYSDAIFKLIDKTIKRQSNFLGIDLDVAATYTIVDGETSDCLVTASVANLIATAPTEEPRPEQFASKVDYLRAKGRWQIAQKAAAAQAAQAPNLLDL